MRSPVRFPITTGCRIARAAAVALVSSILFPTTTHAQVEEVQPGARIRFRAPARFGAEVKGIVLERHGDSLKVAPAKGAPFVIQLPEMQRLSLSRGKSRLLGAGVGALWGSGIYAVLGLAMGVGDCSDCAYQVDAAEMTLAMALAGASGGATIGFLMGRERWERLSRSATPASPALMVRRLPGGAVGVGLSVVQ